MERKLIEQLRSTVSTSKRKMLDAAADAIERLYLKNIDALWLLDEIEGEARNSVENNRPIRLDWLDACISRWKHDQSKDIITARTDRLSSLAMADELIGKEVYITHWWCGLQITALREPQARTVLYASIQKDGRIQLHVKDGTFGMGHLGESVFTDRQEAAAAIRGRTVAVGGGIVRD